MKKLTVTCPSLLEVINSKTKAIEKTSPQQKNKLLTLIFLLGAFLHSTENALLAQRIDFKADVSEAGVESETEVPPFTLCHRVGQGMVWNDIRPLGDNGALFNGVRISTASQYLAMNNNRQPTDMNIKISGTFTIDVFFRFKNCNVKMEEGSEIVLRAKLESSASRFFACSGMWKGIRNEGKSAITFWDKSEIEDALNAIHLDENCTYVNIAESIFNRNSVGIFFQSSTLTSAKSFNLNSFNRNYFVCTSALNNHGWPTAGIKTILINIPTLGYVSGINLSDPKNRNTYANVFSGKIGIGIGSFGSILSVQLCKFVDIADGANLKSGGVGIDAMSSVIMIKGLGIPAVSDASYRPNADEATFLNCRRGAIKANGTSLDVKDCYFEFTQGASANLDGVANIVESFNNIKNEEISVENNYFNMFLRSARGIKVNRSEYVCNISSNIFTFADLGSAASAFDPYLTCIFVSVGSSVNSPCFINTNKVFCQNLLMTLIGIHAQQGKNYFVNQNVIDKLPNLTRVPSIGINMDRCSRPSGVGLNEVIGYEDPNTNQTTSISSIGYRFFNTSLAANNARDNDRFRICFNKAKHCRDGFLFIGNNDHSVFSDNEMERNYTYLRLQKSNSGDPQIGMQSQNWFFRKNLFINFPGGISAGEMAVMESGNPRLSKFKVDTRQNFTCKPGFACSKVAFENIIVPVGFVKEDWFANGGINDTGCDEAPGPWAPMDDAILHGEFDVENEVTLWEAERVLFQKLKDQPDLMEGNPERQQFYTLMGNTNIANFNVIQNGINALFALTESQQITLNNLNIARSVNISNWIDYAINQNSQFGMQEWSDESRSVFTGLSETLEQTQNNIDNMQVMSQADIASKLDGLLEATRNIIPQSIFESAAKNANYYWLRNVQTSGELNDEDLTAVRLLASKCFYEIGTAKYQAADILNFQDYENQNTIVCQDVPMYRTVKTMYKSEHKISVMPNPVSDLLTIEAQNWISLKVYDLSGTEVASFMKNGSTENVLDLSNLTNGLYFLQFVFIDGAESIVKVSVLH